MAAPAPHVKPGGRCPAAGLRRALRAAVLAAIAACLAAFAAWLVLAATPAIKTSAAIKNDLAFSNLSGSTTFLLLTTWAPLLAATLLALLLRRALPAGKPSSAASLGSKQAKRLLSWQLPPRGLWARWCGGLSAGEACGVSAWLFINAWWLGMLLKRSLKPGESSLEQLETVAKSLGKMMAPNLMLLFLPIPHLSFVTWLTGVPRNQLIRYHRWLGHGTLWVLTAHGLLYYAYWGLEHEFWAEFSSWSADGGSLNNLAGSAAYFSVLLLWVSSLEWIRRRLYQLFFRLHLLCFLAFFLLSCAHYAPCWSYFAPGLLLYAADLALRAGQLGNVTAVVAARVDERSGTATLQLKADKSLGHQPPSEVWLKVPGISRWQWHPFTVAGSNGSLWTLHVKSYGAFTKTLVEGLRRRQPTAVRLAGPHGAGEATLGCQLSPPGSWHRYCSVVVIGGGVGITGLLSILRNMAAQRAQQAEGQDAAALQLPGRVRCVWVARSAGEFAALDAPLLSAATSAKGWLDLQLHVTGGQPAIIETEPKAALPSPALALDSSRSGSFKSDEEGSGADAGQGAAGKPPSAPWASPFCWNRLRPVQPQSLGAAHLAAVYVLVYLGGLSGVLLAASYAAQVVAWKGGMLYCVLMSALALGLPFGLAVFPAHAIRYWRHVRRACKGDTDAVVPFSLDADLADSCCTVGEDAVWFGDAAVPVRRGRPDVEGILRTAATELGLSSDGAGAGPGAGVGVYVGGPQPLMTAVHLAVNKLNSESGAGQPCWELHREAVQL